MGKHSILYDLNEEWDLNYVPRSHKAPPRFSSTKAIAFFVAVCMSAIAVTTNVTSSVPPHGPTHVQLVLPPAVASVNPETSPASTTEPPEDPRELPTRASRAQQERPSPIEIAIGFALAQVGKRYSFGASGPNQFDCSGLVMRAFEQIGIKLPHYTGTMLGYGRKVSQSEMVRGDIVFPTSGHVAIYLGNNQMVAASSGRGRIQIQSVYSFYTARRLV